MSAVHVTMTQPPLPDARAVRRSPAWWGTAWLCVTEGMLFACLIASYFFLHGPANAFAAEGGEYPPLTLVGWMTVILLTSSATMWWGERGIREGDARRLRIGLAVTFILGAAFLVMQAIEYHHKSLGPTVSAYQSVFYTTTSLHGAHVAFGLLMNLFVQARAWRGDFSANRHVGVQVASLYWHFVDGVWVVILSALYLSPRLW